MLLREFGEIRHGNTLLVPCMGKKEDGSQHCCGMISIPFDPPLSGSQLGRPTDQGYWIRESVTTLDYLTLRQSVQAGGCGHFTIKNGRLEVQA